MLLCFIIADRGRLLLTKQKTHFKSVFKGYVHIFKENHTGLTGAESCLFTCLTGNVRIRPSNTKP